MSAGTSSARARLRGGGEEDSKLLSGRTHLWRLPVISVCQIRHSPGRAMLSFLGRGRGGEEPEPSSQPMETSDVSLADAERVTLRCEAVLEGHGAEEVSIARVWHCAWDPTGKTLATCSSDKTCRIWAKSAAAGNTWVTVAELEGVHSRTVRQAAWSPCGAFNQSITRRLLFRPLLDRPSFFPINLARCWSDGRVACLPNARGST